MAPRRGNRLVNQWAADHTHALAGATPILALNWPRVAQTYEKCLS
jgi:hypothetical protein